MPSPTITKTASHHRLATSHNNWPSLSVPVPSRTSVALHCLGPVWPDPSHCSPCAPPLATLYTDIVWPESAQKQLHTSLCAFVPAASCICSLPHVCLQLVLGHSHHLAMPQPQTCNLYFLVTFNPKFASYRWLLLNSPTQTSLWEAQ